MVPLLSRRGLHVLVLLLAARLVPAQDSSSSDDPQAAADAGADSGAPPSPEGPARDLDHLTLGNFVISREDGLPTAVLYTKNGCPSCFAFKTKWKEKIIIPGVVRAQANAEDNDRALWGPGQPQSEEHKNGFTWPVIKIYAPGSGNAHIPCEVTNPNVMRREKLIEHFESCGAKLAPKKEL